MNSEEIETLVHSCQEPLVMKNLMNSELESWNLSDWNKLFRDQILTFRSGKNEYNSEPQLETSTNTIKGTFQDFLKHTHDSDTKDWWYFDYKYLRHLPDMEKVEENINWAKLGLRQICSEDGVIWIGSKGAHTCCHKDTYGCNLVYQIYGRKQWLLFPPQENLKSTRIPYEESSIYSKLNFFCPQPRDFDDIDSCYKIILNPGDVLLVPHKWWHYVENLETSISVNNWISLPQDDPEHVKEAIAQIIFSKMTHGLDQEGQKIVLNPNMTDDKMAPVQDLLKIIEACVDSTHPVLQKYDQIELTLEKYNKFISRVPRVSKEEFHQLLRNQRNRFDSEDVTSKEDSRNENKVISVTIVDFLDATTDDEVLSLISKKILEKVRNSVT